MTVHKDVITWFSCGVTSAVALKLAKLDYPNLRSIYCDTGGEHEDNKRFLKDVSRWTGIDIKVIKHPMYKDHFDVFRKTGYINGPTGARCTKLLKRDVRERYSNRYTLHIFGFDYDEEKRADDFKENNPDLIFECPLIKSKLTKSDCKYIIQKACIELPVMYKLGYEHNNCIGCVKGGMGYWNKIRVDFPEYFKKMAEIEREIGNTCIRKDGKKLYLDELDPKSGRFKEDEPKECGPLCQLSLSKVGLDNPFIYD